MMIASQVELIARLNDLIASLRARKKDKKPGAGTVKKVELDKSLLPRPPRSVMLFGSPQMENQVAIFGSDRGLSNNYDKQQPKAPKIKRTSDRRRDLLSYAAQKAAYDCRQKQLDANAAYYRCRAKKGGSPSKCKFLFVSVGCPEAVAARKALSDYLATRPNSGGGGGGGF